MSVLDDSNGNRPKLATIRATLGALHWSAWLIFTFVTITLLAAWAAYCGWLPARARIVVAGLVVATILFVLIREFVIFRNTGRRTREHTYALVVEVASSVASALISAPFVFAESPVSTDANEVHGAIKIKYESKQLPEPWEDAATVRVEGSDLMSHQDIVEHGKHGVFVIPNVPSEAIRLRIELPGYEPVYWPASGKHGTAELADVVLHERELAPTSVRTIRGSVLVAQDDDFRLWREGGEVQSLTPPMRKAAISGDGEFVLTEVGGVVERTRLEVRLSGREWEVVPLEVDGKTALSGEVRGSLRIAAAKKQQTKNVIVSSAFDEDNEGWTLDGRNPIWSPSGGRAGGHIAFLNERGAVRLWDAPAKFLGDQSAALHGTLSFSVSVDLPGSSVGRTVGSALVKLSGTGTSIYLKTPEVLGRRSWKAFSLRLGKAEGWLNTKGGAASDDDIKQVLANLSQLQINADWDGNGNVSNTRLDEVFLMSP